MQFSHLQSELEVLKGHLLGRLEHEVGGGPAPGPHLPLLWLDTDHVRLPGSAGEGPAVLERVLPVIEDGDLSEGVIVHLDLAKVNLPLVGSPHGELELGAVGTGVGEPQADAVALRVDAEDERGQLPLHLALQLEVVVLLVVSSEVDLHCNPE